ncbi:hypothetical protein BDV28DRAFT_140703 [Aspergillus coremiiformis]|uniref:Uncharacterized protein n=1 Tax=Aspergillus coremiiformis TaxID=138285 RepID=A0A5N6YW62_9EURO|nr:hypothetical protein BDV28DRAFT_140703 [Aspergillus coremiiformis]
MDNYIHPPVSQPGSHWIQADQLSVPSSRVPDMMYAFSRPKHTGRVMKPRSAGNSPSSAGRWRPAVSHSSPIYQPVQTQPYQMPINPAVLASAMRRRVRPISWHPASLESAAYSSPPYFQATAPETLAVMAPPTHPLGTAPSTFADGTMLSSYAAPEFSVPNGTFFTAMPDPAPMQQSSFLDMHGAQIDPVTWDTSALNVTMAQPTSDSWPFDMMSMNNSIPSADVEASGYASAPSSGYLTGPSTPDFLPIQHPNCNSKSLHEPTSDEQPGDELVGMGLYSHPDPFLESSFHEVSGKGLKLEETFTPSDDEADDSKDAESEDDDQEPTVQASASTSAPVQNQSTDSAANMVQKSFFFDDDDLESRTMCGPQQLFNPGGQSCMNYGYGWI